MKNYIVSATANAEENEKKNQQKDILQNPDDKIRDP